MRTCRSIRPAIRQDQLCSRPRRTGCSRLFQYLLQKSPCVGLSDFRDLFGAPLGDDVPPALSPLWAKINHPICGLDNIEIVFHDNECITRIDELVQDGQ